jgi:hypothetical protein
MEAVIGVGYTYTTCVYCVPQYVLQVVYTTYNYFHSVWYRVWDYHIPVHTGWYKEILHLILYSILGNTYTQYGVLYA